VNSRWLFAVIAALMLVSPALSQEKKPELRWGTDPTGGAPYVYKPKGGADDYIGFEVELAAYLAQKLGRESKMVDGLWKTLPELLDKPRDGEKGIDIVLNGYELRKDLAGKYGVTRPYYVYRLQLVGRKDNDSIQGWSDLPARAGKKGARIGVLGESVAEKYTKDLFGDRVEILPSDDVANVMEEVKTGLRMDATVQDNPAAVYFSREIPELKLVEDGRAPSFYVIYLRKDDTALRDQIDAALKDGIKDGTLKKLYEKYGLWNDDQERLLYWTEQPWPPFEAVAAGHMDDSGGPTDWPRLLRELLSAAGMTVFLAITSFPIAMFVGLVIAVGRVYGPRWLAFLLAIYVEVIRGTPLLLQLYVIFYMLPKIDPVFALSPLVAGILGLAINYAAYEAENYRAGLQSIPKGQMEAALALGLTPFMAIRKVIVPQAFRIVIPPVTNDFIALFKDTSVCSVILITELTRKYNELYNFNRDLVIQLAFITAGLYLLMSYPMSLLARWLEKRMGTQTHGGHR
jgi:polar amino acid transport system substrate-binding protein